MLANRYLLTPGFDAAPLDAELLRDALSQRLRDLASPAGALIEPWLVRDPTLEMLRLAEHWQPVTEPERRFDVWFDAAGEHALLLAETQAAGFDPAAQEAALACDLFLCVGTSLTVYPAAAFPAVAKRNGARLVILNRDPTDQDDIADLVIHAGAGDVLAAATRLEV